MSVVKRVFSVRWSSVWAKKHVVLWRHSSEFCRPAVHQLHKSAHLYGQSRPWIQFLSPSQRSKIYPAAKVKWCLEGIVHCLNTRTWSFLLCDRKQEIRADVNETSKSFHLWWCQQISFLLAVFFQNAVRGAGALWEHNMTRTTAYTLQGLQHSMCCNVPFGPFRFDFFFSLWIRF